MDKRRLLKTLSWNIISTIAGLSLQYAIFRNLEGAILSITIGNPIFIAMYYLHEKVWYKNHKEERI